MAAKPKPKAKPVNSREKGAGAEREFAKALYEHLGVKLARNLEQSRNGGHDLEVTGDGPAEESLRKFAIEIKRHAEASQADVAKWWRQAVKQAATARRTPVLAFRADRQAWRAVVPLYALHGGFSQSDDIAMTAELSLDAFAMVVREGVA